ncbi:MAG: sodium:calcium antiporter [Acidobacteriota bacterium]
MTWLLFVVAASIIVVAGKHLAFYGDVLGEKTGMGRSWIGVVLLAATTSLPELVTGFSATVLTPLPDIAVGDVVGSCMFNLLILSMMDAVQPEPISARAHQGHALSMGFGLLLIGIASMGLLAAPVLPPLSTVGATTPLLIALYFVAMRVIFQHEQRRLAREAREVAEERQYGAITTREAIARYSAAAVFVVGAALWLPSLGAAIAAETGLGEAFVGSLFIAVTTSLPEIVVSLAAVRMGALDLGIGNVLGSNLFNLFILGLDDVFYAGGPILAAADPSHAVSMAGVVVMYALFLVGLTFQVMTKRFRVSWDTGAIAVVYAAVIGLVFLLRR